MRTARRNKAAIIWEGEPGDRRTLTYWDLFRQVSAFANVLKSLGVKRGDRVALYLPLIPELAIAMLAIVWAARNLRREQTVDTDPRGAASFNHYLALAQQNG